MDTDSGTDRQLVQPPRTVPRGHHIPVDLKDMLETTVARFPERALFKQKFNRNEPFREITFRQVLDDVYALGTAFLDLGLREKKIGVIGKNSYQWCETCSAVTGGVGVIVPLDKELHEEELKQLTVKGELSAVITVENKYYETFKAIKESGESQLEYVINVAMEEDESLKDGYISWNKLRETGRKAVHNGDRKYIDAPVVNTDLSVILFTSGTTDVSKGVMLNQKNLVLDTYLAQTLLEVRQGEDTFFSILPLHHTYECTATFLECVYNGATMAICQGLKYICKGYAGNPAEPVAGRSGYLRKSVQQDYEKRSEERQGKTAEHPVPNQPGDEENRSGYFQAGHQSRLRSSLAESFARSSAAVRRWTATSWITSAIWDSGARRDTA